MTSLAEDLLNDFEDSGSENGGLADNAQEEQVDLIGEDGDTDMAEEEAEATKDDRGRDAVEDEEDTKSRVGKNEARRCERRYKRGRSDESHTSST